MTIDSTQREAVIARLMEKNLTREEAEARLDAHLKTKATPAAAPVVDAPVVATPVVATPVAPKPVKVAVATPAVTDGEPKLKKDGTPKKKPGRKPSLTPKEKEVAIYFPLTESETEALDSHLASLGQKSRAAFSRAVVLAALGLA